MATLTTQDLGFDFQSPVYRFGALETTASNALCVPIIYGKIKAAGNKLWQGSGTTTTVKTTTTTVFNALVSFGEGQISEISNIELNNYPISTLTGCTFSTYLGKGTDDIDSRVPGTTQADKAALVGGLKYTAYVALTVASSNKVANNYMNVTADITGKLIRVYTDTSTYTTIYSNNPAWCIFDFLTCSSGCDMSVDELDIQSFITAASYCDAKVGSETDSRFTLNLILDQRKSRNAWLNQMLVTCRANLKYNSSQKLSLIIEQDDAPVQDFTPDNILAGSEFFWSTPKEKRCDIVKVRYIYPTEQCARVFAVAEADTFLSDPPIIQEFQAFGVTNFKQASRLAWFYLNQANNCNKFISFKTTQIALDRMVGDVITLTSTFLGYQKKKMRIVQLAQAQDGQIQIICRENNGAESSTLTTKLTGNNNDLVYSSVAKNETENSITVKYTDPYNNNQSLNISVSGKDINVSLATDSNGAITTTAAQIKTAIEANSSAHSLVTVANASENDGSGIVTAMAKTNLTGGTVGIYSDTLGGVEPEVNLININDNLDIPDDIQNFSSAQNFSTIILTWQPIDNTSATYEIREGTSWTNSQVVAQGLVGSTHTVPNIQKRTYHYWIAAKNKYGTYSANPKLSLIIINEIPETNTFLHEDILDSDVSQGNFVNCFADQSGITLSSDINWTNTGDWKNSGVYYALNGYWGTDCESTGSYTTKAYDLGIDLTPEISTSNNLSSRDNANNIVIEWRYAEDKKPWTDWQVFVNNGSYTFRYYQFRITMNSPNNKIASLTSFIVNIVIKNRDLGFDDQPISDENTGKTIIFDKSFVTTPAVVANISDGTNGYCVVSAKSPSQITVKAYNNSGTPIKAKVDIRVKGY